MRRILPLLITLLLLVVTASTLCCGCGRKRVSDSELSIDDLRIDEEELGEGWVLAEEIEVGPEEVEEASGLSTLFSEYGATRVLNQFFGRDGKVLQVNMVQLEGEDQAGKALSYMKKSGSAENTYGSVSNIAVEIISDDPDDAARAARLLGLAGGVGEGAGEYEVEFSLACVDRLDYMKANQLSNFLDGYQEGEAIPQDIQAIMESTTFGSSISLLMESGEALEARYDFDPEPLSEARQDGVIAFDLDPGELPARAGVPYVKIYGKLRVGSTDLTHGDGTVLEPGEMVEYLEETTFWPKSDAEVQGLVLQITGSLTDDAEKIRALSDWVRENIRYEGPMGTRYGTMQVLAQRYGRCWDASDVFITLCRASEIPARQVAGWLAGVSGHVWSQVYLEGEGWVSVDTTSDIVGAGQDYIPFFASEDGAMPILYVSFPEVED